MPKISSLTRRKPTSLVFDLDGETITLVFDANKLTSYAASESRRLLVEEDDLLAMSRMIAEALISWDVTDDAGAPLSISAENVGLLSLDAQNQLNKAMHEASSPSDAEGEVSSGASSSPAPTSSEQAQTSPNGPVTSPSPEPSASPSPT